LGGRDKGFKDSLGCVAPDQSGLHNGLLSQRKSFVRFVAKNLIFGIIVNGILIFILVSNCTLLVYRSKFYFSMLPFWEVKVHSSHSAFIAVESIVLDF
jgi:hypothetical protein